MSALAAERTRGAVAMRERLGICQWIHYEAEDDLRRVVELLHELDVKHLRTGISWADFHRPDGPAWQDHVLDQLADFELLLSVWHTPPSISETGSCADPPRRLEDYADFIAELSERYAGCFAAFELWNEPNNRYKWDFPRRDPDWRKFATMIAGAAQRTRQLGITTILGGMIPVDPVWLRSLQDHGALAEVDHLAIHGFPEMWWRDHPNWEWYRDWHSWEHKLSLVRDVAPSRQVWITETGLATWDLDACRTARHRLQAECLVAAAYAPSERIYWYSLLDLDPRRPAIEGFHVDENEYHLGLVAYDGRRKPAWEIMRALLADELDPDEVPPYPSHEHPLIR